MLSCLPRVTTRRNRGHSGRFRVHSRAAVGDPRGRTERQHGDSRAERRPRDAHRGVRKRDDGFDSERVGGKRRRRRLLYPNCMRMLHRSRNACSQGVLHPLPRERIHPRSSLVRAAHRSLPDHGPAADVRGVLAHLGVAVRYGQWLRVEDGAVVRLAHDSGRADKRDVLYDSLVSVCSLSSEREKE